MFNFFHKNKAEELFFHTDIHSHVVPGVDDGSKDLDTSMYLVKSLRGLGINRIITTPHVTGTTFENTPQTLHEPFNQLSQAISAENLDIEISHAAEYRLDEFFEHKVFEKNDFMLLPNDYILIENSFIQQALNFDEMVFELKLKGLYPILAHPERYKYYFQNKSRYEAMHDAEILFQVNLLSFSGHYGADVKNIAFWLLEKGMIDFIGTDLHTVSHVDSIKRFIKTSDYRKLRDKVEVKNDSAFL